MAESHRHEREPLRRTQRDLYSATGYPSVEQLIAEQNTGPVADASQMHRDFWPADEPIEDFLQALHDWRGHERPEPTT